MVPRVTVLVGVVSLKSLASRSSPMNGVFATRATPPTAAVGGVMVANPSKKIAKAIRFMYREVMAVRCLLSAMAVLCNVLPLSSSLTPYSNTRTRESGVVGKVT